MLTTLSDELFNIEVAQDIDLLNFKALCEFECGIPASQIAILWNGRPLHDDKLKLKDYGIGDGEMLLIQRIQGARGNPSTGASGPSRSPGPGGEWNAARTINRSVRSIHSSAGREVRLNLSFVAKHYLYFFPERCDHKK